MKITTFFVVVLNLIYIYTYTFSMSAMKCKAGVVAFCIHLYISLFCFISHMFLCEDNTIDNTLLVM